MNVARPSFLSELMGRLAITDHAKKMVARFDFVPVVEVSAANFSEVWPFMVHAINESSFMAVDTVGTQLISCIRHA